MYPLFEGVTVDIVDRTGDKRNTLEKPVTPVTLRHSEGGRKSVPGRVENWRPCGAAYHPLKRACADGADIKEYCKLTHASGGLWGGLLLPRFFEGPLASGGMFNVEKPVRHLHGR